MKSKILMLSTLLLIAIGTALGQTINVKGVVYDEMDLPAIGATIRLKSDATKGTQTNMNGEFALTGVPQGAIIVVSSVGYKTQELPAAPNMIIKLVPDSELLDEVVVIGYTSRSVANTSASVVKVSSKDIAEKPTANILEAAQGKVAGVQVLTSSGEPSEISSMKFHGAGSLGASSTPLYILDGMPVSAGIIQSLNPNDFESMQFLKDAAATSIYGARAANGVVYIQTKRGKMAERATITFRGQYGVSKLANSQYYDKMMSTSELLNFWEKGDEWFQEHLGGKYYGDAKLKSIRDTYGMNDTKWWKYFYQTAPMYQGDVTISGGSQNTNYYISTGIFNQKGLRAGSDYSKLNLRMNLNSTLNSVVKVGLNNSISYDKARISPDSYARGEIFAGLQPMLNPPFYTPYDENGNEYYDTPIPGLGVYNPKYSMANDVKYDYTLYLNLAGNVTITPFENFQIRSQAGLEFSDFTRDHVRKPSWIRSAGNGFRERRFTRSMTLTTNNVAEYKFSVNDDHNFIALIGQEYVDYTSSGFTASGEGMNNDNLMLLSHATKEKNVSETFAQYAFLSFFGQFSYDFQKKYFLDLVVRNDASSRFGANNRNATFWSAGLLWKAKKEDFLKDVNWLSDLDVKASYGTQGNAGIGNYQALATVRKSGQYNGAIGWALGTPGNPNLTWESQDKLTVGFSANLWNRLQINLEFYNRLTRNMLMDVPMPYSSGLSLDSYDFASYPSNVGVYQNRGIDLALSGDIISEKDYGLSAYLNLNYNKDKVIELFQGRDQWILPNYGFGYIVGQPVMFIYPIFKDIDPDTGNPRWYLPAVDSEGNSIKKENTQDDSRLTSDFDNALLEQNTGMRRYPATTGGFGLNAYWKGFSLQADFAFVLGKWMVANESFFTMNPYWFDGFNADKAVNDYWKKPGDVAQFPSLAYQLSNPATQFDSRLISNASFMRMKNLTIGYSLQDSLLKGQNVIKGAKIYGTARNLFTITKYNGHDPEVDSNLSRLTNPNTRQFIVGLELTF